MSQSSIPAPHEIPDETSVEAITLDQLENAVTKLGAECWRNKRNDRRYPAREDISARDLSGALRSMMLVKVLDGGKDFEYRIVGDAQVRAYAMPLHNRCLNDVAIEAPALSQLVRKIYLRVAHSGEPIAIRGRIGRDIPEANFTYNESVFLPLGASDDAVDHLLIFSSYIMRLFSLYGR